MKALLFLIVLAILPIPDSISKSPPPGKPTVAVILKKLNEKYDPFNRWSEAHLSYTVNIIGQDGDICTADVETSGPNEFFQISISSNGQKIVKRYEYGEYFASIDHITDIPLLEKYNFGTSNEKIDQCMDFFRLINGSVMEMKRAGMKPRSGVKIIDFEGRNCFVLNFRNNTNNTDNSFCVGKIRLYVDRSSYDLVGLELTESPNTNYYKLVFNNFNCQSGIIMPQFIKAYNNTGDLISTKMIRLSSKYDSIAYIN